MMNNQHVSIQDQVMMLSDTSSDIEEAGRDKSVSFTSNEEKIAKIGHSHSNSDVGTS